jgi:hypothetical protein
MKRMLFLAVMAVFWLSACTANPPVSVTETPAAVFAATPNASLATPTVGFVTVRKLENMQALLLRSQPDHQAALTGQVAPGASGKVLGLNAAGDWALLQFPEASGWAPVPVLELTIAQ